jgi:hypothetical protein
LPWLPQGWAIKKGPPTRRRPTAEAVCLATHDGLVANTGLYASPGRYLKFFASLKIGTLMNSATLVCNAGL